MLRFCRATLAALVLLLPAAAQTTNACSDRGTLTTAPSVSTATKNNTVNPNCNAWALTWVSTGFTALSIQIQGSNDNVTYTAYTGATTVLVGSNPSTALSGAIVIQASSRLAYLQVKLNSVSGSGTVNWQLYGANGVTPAAKGGGAASSVNWSDVMAGTNTRGFLQVGSPTVIEPTPINPGGIYATQVVDGNDLAALTISTPGGPTIDLLNVLPSVGGAGATVTARAIGADSNIHLDLLSKGSGVVHIGSTSAFVDASGNLTVVSCTGCSAGSAFSAITNGTNTTAAMLVGTGASLGPSGTGTVTATQVPAAAGATATTNGSLKYDTTADNLHAAQAGADAIVVPTKITPVNGHCVEWLNSGGTLDFGDAGFVCGSGGASGGGVIVYSSSADALAGTQFLPPGGGGPASSTESDVQVASPAAATVSNLQVRISSALGAGNSTVFTWRDAGASTTSTCTISGAVSKTCSDTTHSFTPAAGDLLDMQTVTTGVVTPANVLFTSAFGTSNVGVTSVFGNVGPVVAAIGDIGATGQVLGIKGVPLCTGFTPLTTQNLQYSTALSPNPCWTAAAGGGASGVTQISQQILGAPAASITFSAIPGTYTSLWIQGVGRFSDAVTAENLLMQFNGDTGSNYNTQFINTNSNTSPATGFQTAVGIPLIGAFPGASATATHPGFVDIRILGYAQTTFTHQAIISGNFFTSGGTPMTLTSLSYEWANTAAVTSVKFSGGTAGNFVAGTVFTLYGIQ